MVLEVDSVRPSSCLVKRSEVAETMSSSHEAPEESKAKKAVRFDEKVLEKLAHEAKQRASREVGEGDGESSLSDASMGGDEDDAFFKVPTDDPDLIEWQFRIAVENRDPLFLDKILRFERERIRAGEDGFEIPMEDKSKQLALAMLSGDEEMYKVLAQFVPISAADEWFSCTHPASRCNCEDNHIGSLLIRLVRAGQRAMATRALKGGLDPNASICDGDMERMFWSVENPDSRRETAKLEAIFRKSTALTAAASTGDTRMLELLLDFGADPEAHDYVVFAVAARHGHISVLQALLANPRFDDFNKLGRGCVVALKMASIENQTKTIDWLLLRLQQFDDWEVRAQPRKKSMTATVGRTFSGRRSAIGSSLRAKSARLYSRKKSLSLLPNSASSSKSSKKNGGQSKQLVSEALNSALDELIKDGKRPGSVMRQALTKGIETVLRLQKKHLSVTDFDPRKLLAFYVSASTDQDIFTPEDVAKRLFGMGLEEYLLGKKADPLMDTDESCSLSSDDEAESTDASKRLSVQSLTCVPHDLPVSGSSSAAVSSFNSTRAKMKALTVFTTKTLKNVFMATFQSGALSYGSSQHKSSSGLAVQTFKFGAVASEKERKSAVTSAVQCGHLAVVKQLIPVCSDDMLETLLEQAAQYHQMEIVEFLLLESADRKLKTLASKSLVSPKEEAEFSLENPRLLDSYLVSRTLMAALAVGDLEIAAFLLGKGGRLSTTQITQVFERIVTTNEKSATRAIPKLFDLALDTDFGSTQLSHVFDIGFEAENVNYRALRGILVHSRFHFVNMQHILALIHRSSGRSHEDFWRSLCEQMVKNFLRSDNDEAVNKDLNALLYEAETLPQVHVGVLTLLMHSCDLEDPDSDLDSTGMPSRWL